MGDGFFDAADGAVEKKEKAPRLCDNDGCGWVSLDSDLPQVEDNMVLATFMVWISLSVCLSPHTWP